MDLGVFVFLWLFYKQFQSKINSQGFIYKKRKWAFYKDALNTLDLTSKNAYYRNIHDGRVTLENDATEKKNVKKKRNLRKIQHS